jgi:hypothetical protein
MLVKVSAAITAPAIILRILFSFEPRVIYKVNFLLICDAS